MDKAFFNLFYDVLIRNWLFFDKRHQDISFQRPSFVGDVDVVAVIFLPCGQV